MWFRILAISWGRRWIATFHTNLTSLLHESSTISPIIVCGCPVGWMISDNEDGDRRLWKKSYFERPGPQFYRVFWTCLQLHCHQQLRKMFVNGLSLWIWCTHQSTVSRSPSLRIQGNSTKSVHWIVDAGGRLHSTMHTSLEIEVAN